MNMNVYVIYVGSALSLFFGFTASLCALRFFFTPMLEISINMLFKLMEMTEYLDINSSEIRANCPTIVFHLHN